MAKRRLRVTLSSLLAGILITIGGCSEQSAINTAPETGKRYQRLELPQQAGGASYDRDLRAEQVIGAAGGTLMMPGGHTLEFPAGALSAPTTIKARVDSRYIQVDLEPHGIQFPAGREPVLTLSYAAAATAAPASGLTIIYLDQAGSVLEDMNGTANADTKVVVTRLPHFSKYAVANGN